MFKFTFCQFFLVEFLNVHFLFQVNWMNLRDADSGKILWQGSDDLSQPGKKFFRTLALGLPDFSGCNVPKWEK
jgi:hypothetical protein